MISRLCSSYSMTRSKINCIVHFLWSCSFQVIIKTHLYSPLQSLYTSRIEVSQENLYSYEIQRLSSVAKYVTRISYNVVSLWPLFSLNEGHDRAACAYRYYCNSCIWQRDCWLNLQLLSSYLDIAKHPRGGDLSFYPIYPRSLSVWNCFKWTRWDNDGSSLATDDVRRFSEYRSHWGTTAQRAGGGGRSVADGQPKRANKWNARRGLV